MRVFLVEKKKRNEILQMLTLEPELSIMDETDSGLDIDALKTIATGINRYRNHSRSFLVITHYQRLLKYIEPDFVHVLIDGRIVKSGGKELALDLEKKDISGLNHDTCLLPTRIFKIIDREYFSNKTHPIREKAFKNFLKQGFPNKKKKKKKKNKQWEDWKYTNLSQIKKGKFRLSEIKDAPKKEIDVSEFGLQTFQTIVIYNGHLQKNLSTIPEGVKILSNLEYLENNNWKVEQPVKSSFDLLNTAFMDSGISLIVDENKEIKEPLRILFISSGEDNIMVNPRIHLDVKSLVH